MGDWNPALNGHPTANDLENAGAPASAPGNHPALGKPGHSGVELLDLTDDPCKTPPIPAR
jgi:hypothetical protein